MTATQNQTIPLNGFRWMDADAYLFDIDGTLLVTRDLVHRNALHHAMRELYGVDTTIDGIAYHGKTDLGILRAALGRMGISGEVFEANLPAAFGGILAQRFQNPAGTCPTKGCRKIAGRRFGKSGSGRLAQSRSGWIAAVLHLWLF